MVARAFALLRPMSLRGLPAVVALLTSLSILPVATEAVSAADDFSALYADISLPWPTTDLIVVCHGVGCRYRTEIVLSGADRVRITTLLAPGRASPTFERRAIATAVAWWDRRIGPVAGTTHRVEHAGIDETGDPGQMDSIDISTNITSLFLVLDQLKLLRHHQVEPPASRFESGDGGTLQTVAVLSENNGGRKWVVDNWTQNYGDMPDVEFLETWQSERN